MLAIDTLRGFLRYPGPAQRSRDTAARERRSSGKLWTAVLLGLLCYASCSGSDHDRGAREPVPGQPPLVERFVGPSDGIVQDTRAGLEWTSHDNKRNFAWHEADRYCRDLRLGGRTDWRLPEIDELEGLYDKRLDQPCGDLSCHLDPAIGLTNPYVWSATQRGPLSRFYFDFQGGASLSPHLKPGLVRRALCVRRFTP